jgi:acyl transferase domain-containing protein
VPCIVKIRFYINADLPFLQPQYAATGNGIAIMSNRISWFYDLKGPSMTLDTGCSASLVGVHLACQSLRTGESTMASTYSRCEIPRLMPKQAIAMGAGLILTPSTMMPMTALNFLSPDGKCFTFDERANGYGRGEGIGAVVLKPLETALKDNDTIRAIIRGSGVNQDGRTPGITMPSKDAQAINIRAVYKAADLGYDQTAYFEAHGTGTQAGDPTELGAISETFAETRSSDGPIFVGSVKTNIGHLEGCAGIAGFVKGVLMLENGLIPPNLYFEKVNPNIDLDAWKIKVSQHVRRKLGRILTQS